MKHLFFLAGLCWLGGCKDTSDETGAPPDSGPDGPVPTWSAAFENSGGGALSGVWGSGPSDVFVVGGDADGAEIWHFDGSQWAAMRAPEDASLLVWVAGFGPDDVWAVGLDGTMVHYDGAAWSPVQTNLDVELWGVFGRASDDLWVVGGDPDTDDICGDAARQGEKSCIWHWDGSSLAPVALPEGENDRRATSIFKVWGVGDALVAVGQKGLLLSHDGTDWRRESAGAEANEDFVSCAGTAPENIVCVGGRGNARIATRDAEGWDTVAPSGLGGLNAVAMTGPDEAIVGGIYGWVGRYTPGQSDPVEEGLLSSEDIHAMWWDGQDRTYAVGGHFLPPYSGVAFVRTVE